MGAPSYTFNAERLEALEQFAILDTPPERGFDDIVELAAYICETPVALVSFVANDRQWFKARIGIDDCQTDLNSSVCAHALVEPDLLVVPDLSQDPRTLANPLVVGAPFIRFYAGAPLRTGQGQVVGSLCVIDTKPRPEGLTEAQANALRNLGRQVIGQLELRRAITQRDGLLAGQKEADTRRNGLLRIGDRLRDAATIGEMTRAAATIIGETLKVERAAFGHFDETGQFVDVEPDWTADGVASIAGRHRLADYGENLQERLLSGDALIIPDVRTDPVTADQPDALLGLGIRSLVNLPVVDHGRVVAMLIVHTREPRSWPPEILTYLRNIADRVETGIARLQAEARQRLLNHELSHRMKNTMAMVQAVASQTLKGVPDKAPVKAFSDRMVALSVAHDVLLQKNWSAAEVRDIVETTICTFADIGRFDITGPMVTLGSRAALSLSLLLHELTTNALKYGALSNETGKIALGWRTNGHEDGLQFELHWHESGGPNVEEPTRKGFGSRLINVGLGGMGGAELRFDPSGLDARFIAPLADLENKA
ncbi:MAG: GAF domain-containing protein [Bradyrhizobium sp.]